MIPLRSLAWKALAQRSNNWRISASLLAPVSALGLESSRAQKSARTENTMNFFMDRCSFSLKNGWIMNWVFGGVKKRNIERERRRRVECALEEGPFAKLLEA